jgi:hypothetical protein
MALSPEERELLKLRDSHDLQEILRKHAPEIARLKQLAGRSGPARGALDRLHVEIIMRYAAPAFVAACSEALGQPLTVIGEWY